MFDPAQLKGTNTLRDVIPMTKNLKSSQEVPIIYHDFFFHSGKLGAIRIEIMTLIRPRASCDMSNSSASSLTCEHNLQASHNVKFLATAR